MSQFKIESIKHARIDMHHGYIPFIYSLSNGQIILKCFTGSDKLMEREQFIQSYSEKACKKTSQHYMEDLLTMKEDLEESSDIMYRFFMTEDQGNSWQHWGCPNFTVLKELKNGSLLGLFRFSFVSEKGHFLKTWRSYDLGKTWVGPEYAQIIGPNLETNKKSMKLVCFHRNMLELDDGSLIVTAYTRFKGDKKSRAVVYRSLDEGKSFYYYSTIGYDPTVESRAGINETSMALLNNGDLLCIMRTNAYLPMLQSRSSNGGATWSEPKKVGFDGVDPDVIVLNNGSLALSYGRPGVWVSFSRDGTGLNWMDKVCLWSGCISRESIQYYRYYDKAKYDYYMNSVLECERSLCLERSCCYTALHEVSPGKILIAYSAPADPNDYSPLKSWNKEMIKNFYIWIAEITFHN